MNPGGPETGRSTDENGPDGAVENPYGTDGRGSGGRHAADPAGGVPASRGGPDGTDGSGPGPDGEEAEDVPERKPRSFWKELPLLIGIALVLALIIKTFLVQAFSIPSDSMQNTLQRGDRVLVDKLTPWFGSKPSRGEVVVFHDPGGWLGENPPAAGNFVSGGLQTVLSFVGLMPSAEEKDLIKRVIAVGGDTVECKGGNSEIIVNGKTLDEPFIYGGNTPCGDKPFGPIKIQPNKIWVMGDHRQDSLDSRYHQDLPGGGQVDDDKVVGRAIVIAWPLNRISGLPIPSTFHQPGVDAASGAVPAAAGLVGAVPLVLLRRRRLLRRAAPAAPKA